ncbi:MAG: hypothetical protein ACYC6L_06400 [Anaerolineae bacterium]
MSILDSITAAFKSLAGKLWLLLVPVVLDVFLWLGPKLSAAPLIKDLFAYLQQTISSTAATAQTSSSALLSSGLAETEASFQTFNWMTLLSWGRVGVPSVSGLLPIKASYPLVLYIGTSLQLVLAVVVVLAVGLMLACIFIGMIGQVIKGERFNLAEVLKRAPTHWLNLAVIYVPLSFIFGAALMLSVVLGPLAFIVWVGILWILLYLFFVPQAVIIGNATPLEALRNSFIVVRLNFWSSLGFVFLVNVISAGFALIWGRLVATQVGIGVSIIFNAFIGTGLLIATCIYYVHRMEKWHTLLQQLRASAQHDR